MARNKDLLYFPALAIKMESLILMRMLVLDTIPILPGIPIIVVNLMLSTIF
jgi:hypothetical protein